MKVKTNASFSEATSITSNAISIRGLPTDNLDIKMPTFKPKKNKELDPKELLKQFTSLGFSLKKKLFNKLKEREKETYEEYVFNFN